MGLYVFTGVWTWKKKDLAWCFRFFVDAVSSLNCTYLDSEAEPPTPIWLVSPSSSSSSEKVYGSIFSSRSSLSWSLCSLLWFLRSLLSGLESGLGSSESGSGCTFSGFVAIIEGSSGFVASFVTSSASFVSWLERLFEVLVAHWVSARSPLLVTIFESSDGLASSLHWILWKLRKDFA